MRWAGEEGCLTTAKLDSFDNGGSTLWGFGLGLGLGLVLGLGLTKLSSSSKAGLQARPEGEIHGKIHVGVPSWYEESYAAVEEVSHA